MKPVLLYDGAIRAHRIGSFIRLGEAFDVIHPGYDAQGRRRTGWTQVVHQGVPIYEQKLPVKLDAFLLRFDALWDKWIGEDKEFLEKVLKSTKNARLGRFKDQKTGEAPAPGLTNDGREQGQIYVG